MPSNIKITVTREDDNDLDDGLRHFVHDLKELLRTATFTVKDGEEMTNAIEFLVER